MQAINENILIPGLIFNKYQLPLILTACCTLPDKHCLSHAMCLYQVMMTLHFLNDVASDAESTKNRKSRHNC